MDSEKEEKDLNDDNKLSNVFNERKRRLAQIRASCNQGGFFIHKYCAMLSCYYVCSMCYYYVLLLLCVMSYYVIVCAVCETVVKNAFYA